MTYRTTGIYRHTERVSYQTAMFSSSSTAHTELLTPKSRNQNGVGTLKKASSSSLSPHKQTRICENNTDIGCLSLAANYKLKLASYSRLNRYETLSQKHYMHGNRTERRATKAQGTHVSYLSPGRINPVDGNTVHSTSSVENDDTFHRTPLPVLLRSRRRPPLKLSLLDDASACWDNDVVVVVLGSSMSVKSPSSRPG